MQEVTGSSPVPSTKTTRLIRVGSFCFGGRYRTRTARHRRRRGNKHPSGVFVSARFPTPRNVYRDDCRFVVDGTGLEQHGTAAGGATNTPVGCVFVRGSQRLGMSIGMTAVLWWTVQDENRNKQRQGITMGAVSCLLLFLIEYVILGSVQQICIWRIESCGMNQA